MKRIIACAVLLLLPVAVGAQTFNVNLAGDAGQGFAAIVIDGTTINYSIISSGLDPAPNSASLTDGSTTVDLMAGFNGLGSASGSVTSSSAPDIAANPSAWTLNVGNGTDTLSGTLGIGGSDASTEVYFAVSANIAGAASTNFKSDARVVNRSGETATVTFDYYAEGPDGHTAPTASETVTVGNNVMGVYDNFVADFFGVTNGKGGVKISADRAVLVSSRVYNDQIAAGEGTFGLFVDAVDMDQAYQNGVISFLEMRPTSTADGFRGALGWFNPTSSTVSVTFTAWGAEGTSFGSVTEEVSGLAQEQFFISDLWTSLTNQGDMYITYSADGAIFVYGTITDNTSGDGTYIPAAQSN